MNKRQPDLNSEQLEVLKVVEADLNAYLARDREAWERTWVRNDSFQSIMQCGPLQIANGYEAFQKNVFAAMDAEPGAIQANVGRENLRVNVHDDYAWVSFEQLVTETDNPHALGNLSYNFRLLVRMHGQWRVIFHGVWAQGQRDAQTPSIEVSENCEVIWMNPIALERLKDFPGLQISQGILRASRPHWDELLREQVLKAHELTSFAKYNRAASEGGGSVTFPVVLGEDHDGVLLICWVKVSDGRLYVLFGANSNLEQQIEVAQVVYGLSDAQTGIVRLIANGMEMAAISTELSVSTNTVKTHLKRVFEKVGVKSQVDLLRRLVSFSV